MVMDSYTWLYMVMERYIHGYRWLWMVIDGWLYMVI